MLAAGLVVLLAEWYGVAAIILLLSLIALLAAFYIRTLPEVSKG